MNNKWKEMLPLIGLFVAFGNGFMFCRNFLQRHDIDYRVLLTANLVFFIVSTLVYRMQKKATQNSNPNVFVRTVMGGTMIKMAVCIIGLAVYAFAFKSRFTKTTVFVSMLIYIAYLAVEVAMATKMNKYKNA